MKQWLCGIAWGALLLASSPQQQPISTIEEASSSSMVSFQSSQQELSDAFHWAKGKALSFAHDGTDPVGYWYEAALPNREAFCMRDVSHQTIGAEILGLSKHNYNMMFKFAQNISKEKDYCSYWEINRYDKPAPVDYESDQDFWYNLPANFDVIYNAYRLYQWTGNTDYLKQPEFIRFYQLSLNEYVDHWELGHDQVRQRDRSMHLQTEGESRFGNKRGIPTYNEGGRGDTKLGIDMTASLIAAYAAYADMLELSGQTAEAREYEEKAQREQQFLNAFWWDQDKQTYRSIWYADDSFDYFMVGDNQAFLHYLYYFDVIPDQERITQLTEEYARNFDRLIVELKSYLPIMFYENGQTQLANEMIIDLCSEVNHRRDYPENSFTIIEHITRGLMGIEVEAASRTVRSLSRLESEEDWAEMTHLPLMAESLSLKHTGKKTSTLTLHSGTDITWKAQFPGTYEFLYINGEKTNCLQGEDHGQPLSWCEIKIQSGEEVVVSCMP